MGVSEKPCFARGRFGEGFKMGILALLRKGYKVEIFSHNLYIVPKIVEHPERSRGGVYEEVRELMVEFNESDKEIFPGTIFIIYPWTLGDFSDRIALNLKDKVIWQSPVMRICGKERRAQLLEGKLVEGKRKGRIFLRDIFVEEGNYYFTYNLWLFNIDVARKVVDRNSLDKSIAFEVLTRLEDKELWKIYLKLATGEGEYQEAHLLLPLMEERYGVLYWDFIPSGFNTDKIKAPNTEEVTLFGEKFIRVYATHKWVDAVKQAWKELFGDKAVAKTPLYRLSGRMGNILVPALAWLGYTTIDLKGSWFDFLYYVLPTDEKALEKEREKLKKSMQIPTRYLGLLGRRRLRLARTIAKRLAELLPKMESIITDYGLRLVRTEPPVDIMAAKIPDPKTEGCVDKEKKMVLIKRDIVENKPLEWFMAVLIHELAHWFFDTEDGTSKHIHAIQLLSSILMTLLVEDRSLRTSIARIKHKEGEIL